MKKQKLVLAIHDLSGIGRSSLSVIIPVMSSMKVQVCSVPTAILSTHTGGFGEVVFNDCSDYMLPTLDHYKKINLTPDTIYTGFLGSAKQVDHCIKYFEAFPYTLKLVDPVMGDDGKAYSTITDDIKKQMKKLVTIADIVTPNLTEACLLLDREYPHAPPCIDDFKEIAKSIAELGPGEVVLKGGTFTEGTISNIIYKKSENRYTMITRRRIPASYPGTGDIFASAFLAELLNGSSCETSVMKSSAFVEFVVDYTLKLETDPCYGVAIEDCLSWLFTGQNIGNCEII